MMIYTPIDSTTFHVVAKTFLVFIVFIMASCTSTMQGDQTQDSFPVMHPLRVDTVLTKEYVADIQSIQNVELRTRVGGFIEKIHVDEGQAVHAGQVLFSLGSQGFRDELQKANALLKSAVAEAKVAEVEHKTAQRLVDRNVVSGTELELADARLEAIRARIDEARSAVSTAQLNLSFTEIRAPFSGVINRIPNKAGSLIDEGALLTTLSNNSEVFAYFNMSEREYLEYISAKESGQHKEVSLVMANERPYPQKGIIETTDSEIDKNTGTISFRARFTNPGHILKHGSSGKIVVETELKQALLVPQKSTFEIQENLYVYLVNSENVVEMRSIVPQARIMDLYVVQSGVTPADNIIFEGIQRVKNGDTVTPQPLP